MRIKTTPNGHRSTRLFRVPLALLAAALAVALPARTSGDAPGTVIRAEVSGGPVTPHSFDGDIRDLPVVEDWRPGDPIREIPRRFYPSPEQELAHAPPWIRAERDPLGDLQNRFDAGHAVTALGAPIVNIGGSTSTGVSPPDVTNDVGTSHVIHGYNGSSGSLFRIYNKTGTLLAGPTAMESLGTGACATGAGDPIVLFDRLADRWFMLEFVSGGNNLCIYVSKTANPVTGGWWGYTFVQATFPDYPHCAVWPDGYYCTANQGQPPVYAFDRVNMLTGAAARPQQTFRATSLTGYGFQALTPAHFNGATAPPAGSPFWVVRHNDDEAHAGGGADGTKDFIDMYSVAVNWTTPASSAMTTLPRINITEFNSWLLDYSTFATVPQPGLTSNLDPIREVILNSVIYRNFGTHQTIVGNLATNQDPARTGSVVDAAVRWFELRKVGAGAWTLQQEGTFSPGDANTHHLMGGISVDQSGNIALGYGITKTSAPTQFVSLKYTGRRPADAAGTMTQGEQTIIAGSSVETSGRWGDYAQMGLDPVDDCTFWFSSMYRDANSWETQIASFKFSECGCVVTPTAVTAAASAPIANRITVTWNDSATGSITQYFVNRALAAGGPYTLIATIPDTNPGGGYSYNDNTVSGGTTYYYQIVANDGAACSSPASNTASATATGTCTLAPSFAGATSAVNNGTATCGITVNWAAGASNCGGGLTYSVYRSTTPGFIPAPANRIALGVGGTSYIDSASLASGTTYYYVVRSTDSQGNSDANPVERSATPTGAGGGTTTYTSTDVPKAIPDNNPTGVTSNLVITGNANTITDVNVTMNATHTWDGDLTFSLIAPNATNVTLSALHGGSGDNYTNTVLDDAAATAISAGAPPFTGSFRPDAALTAVNGIPANGTWMLKAVDSAAADIGNITGWSLAVTTAAACSPCAPAPAMSVNRGSKVSTNVVQTWPAVVGASTYNVYRNPSTNVGTWGAALATGIAGLTYSDAGQLSNATSQFYSVTDVNACGSESPK